MDIVKNYINGDFHNPSNNEWINNYNPSDGKVYGKIPNSNKIINYVKSTAVVLTSKHDRTLYFLPLFQGLIFFKDTIAET